MWQLFIRKERTLITVWNQTSFKQSTTMMFEFSTTSRRHGQTSTNSFSFHLSLHFWLKLESPIPLISTISPTGLLRSGLQGEQNKNTRTNYKRIQRCDPTNHSYRVGLIMVYMFVSLGPRWSWLVSLFKIWSYFHCRWLLTVDSQNDGTLNVLNLQSPQSLLCHGISR